jgi:hypothetical protein
MHRLFRIDVHSWEHLSFALHVGTPFDIPKLKAPKMLSDFDFKKQLLDFRTYRTGNICCRFYSY